MEGREAVQCTVMDAAFCFIAATLLMCAGGEFLNTNFFICKVTISRDFWPAKFGNQNGTGASVQVQVQLARGTQLTHSLLKTLTIQVKLSSKIGSAEQEDQGLPTEKYASSQFLGPPPHQQVQAVIKGVVSRGIL